VEVVKRPRGRGPFAAGMLAPLNPRCPTTVLRPGGGTTHDRPQTGHRTAADGRPGPDRLLPALRQVSRAAQGGVLSAPARPLLPALGRRDSGAGDGCPAQPVLLRPAALRALVPSAPFRSNPRPLSSAGPERAVVFAPSRRSFALL